MQSMSLRFIICLSLSPRIHSSISAASSVLERFSNFIVHLIVKRDSRFSDRYELITASPRAALKRSGRRTRL